ncbi:MAG: sigma-70 family RNA polymerase sigma factor [Oscillospiraceae bacterium]|nr:sigma-70 family RNA polymerase sigma factor [Oscillospiraceae bacterium]
MGKTNVEELFTRCKDDVYRLALSYTRSPQEAEDVCQTVFLKLLEQSRITPGKERAWLMQVTANECRNLLRSAWWKRTEPLDETLPAAGNPEGEGVYAAVMALPPKYRVVVYLRYFEEYSTAEIAQLLHISQSAVTTRLERARKRLRPMLEEVNT